MNDLSSRTVQDVSIIEFPKMGGNEAWINVYEAQNNVPFQIARVFNVSATKPCQRGRHAHRECTQLIVCVAGAVKLSIKDGIEACDISLVSGGQGALIKPGLWVEVEFVKENSVIMVLCDLPYDEAEYIRVWDEFLRHKGMK